MRGKLCINNPLLAPLMMVLLVIMNACERNDYELLDPATAGVWTVYNTSNGLPGNKVTDIILDSKSNLWFTCPGYGSAKLENGSMTYYRTSTSPILSDAVNCMDEAADGSILFGTFNGLSVLGANNVWSSYVDPVNVTYINTIKVSSDRKIWLGTQNQGLFVNSGSGFTKFLSDPYKNVNAIEEGKPGKMYIGTDNGVVSYDGASFTYITKSDGLPSNRVTAIRYDRKERLWIGTDIGKTASYIDKTGMHHLNLMASTDSINIKDIFEDRQGNIWFATSRNGLIKYDGVIPYTYKEYNGLPENIVNCIAEDSEGNLWFGLNSKGVVKYTLPIDLK